jgi:predicted acyl esterase
LRGSWRANLKHNGRVGLWGVSYGGFYAAAALPRAIPPSRPYSPQAPIADLYLGDDSYHNGAFMLAANFSFYTGFFPRRNGPDDEGRQPAVQLRTQDGYAFYLGLADCSRAAPAGSRPATPTGRTTSRIRPTTRSGSPARSRRTCATSRRRC